MTPNPLGRLAGSGDLRRGAGLPGWRHPAAVIARAEVVTGTRSVLGNSRQLAGFALMALFVGQMQFLLLGVAIATGETLVGSDPPIGSVAGALVAVVGIGAYSGLHQVARGSDAATVRPLLATSMSPRSVVVGQSLAEFLKLLAFLGALTALLLLGVGVGARNPLLLLALVAGALPLLWAGLLVGRVSGLALRSAYRRIPGAHVVRIVTIGGVTIGAVVWWMRLVEAERVGDAASTLLDLASIGPMRAYVRTLLVSTGAIPDPIDVAITLGILSAVAVTTAVVVRIETARDARERPHRHGTAGSRSVPAAIGTRPSLRIGWRYLLLGVRNPSRFSHLLVLLVAFVSAGSPALTDPSLAVEYAPEIGLVLGTALAGGAYCLNPLGDDREQHPLLLTASTSFKPLLRGRGVAGIALASVVLVLGLAVGLLDGRVLAVVGYLAIAPLLFLSSVGTALGFGAAVPSYERNQDGGTIQPSSMATIPFLFGAMIVGALGALLVYATARGAAPSRLVVCWVLFATTIVATGVLGYRYAVGRFDELTLDAY